MSERGARRRWTWLNHRREKCFECGHWLTDRWHQYIEQDEQDRPVWECVA